jgi:hypothetical protein
MSKTENNNQNLYYKNHKNIIETNNLSLSKSNLFKYYFFFILLISKFNIILCEDKNLTKTVILLSLLVIIFIIIITLIILFIVWCCKKRREENINNFFEGTNYLERDNPEESNLRERVSINYPKALSDYLKEKLISDKYNKKFELFGTQCPICLESFEENKSIIIIGGCLHIFHQKCLSELAEKVDINKNIISQFICPTCRNNLIDGAEKIKMCIKKFPNFFDEMYKNKKLTKIKHIKLLINSLLEEKTLNLQDINSKLKLSEDKNNETDKIKEENEDISYDNKTITKRKLKNRFNPNNYDENIINININNYKANNINNNP